jgi:hypothetical protein
MAAGFFKIDTLWHRNCFNNIQKNGGLVSAIDGCRITLMGDLAIKQEGGMETLDELIEALSTPEVSVRNGRARATCTCKLCGEPARRFRDAVSEFEYRISAICQRCQDRYFYCGNERY